MLRFFRVLSEKGDEVELCSSMECKVNSFYVDLQVPFYLPVTFLLMKFHFILPCMKLKHVEDTRPNYWS